MLITTVPSTVDGVFRTRDDLTVVVQQSAKGSLSTVWALHGDTIVHCLTLPGVVHVAASNECLLVAHRSVVGGLLHEWRVSRFDNERNVVTVPLLHAAPQFHTVSCGIIITESTPAGGQKAGGISLVRFDLDLSSVLSEPALDSGKLVATGQWGADDICFFRTEAGEIRAGELRCDLGGYRVLPFPASIARGISTTVVVTAGSLASSLLVHLQDGATSMLVSLDHKCRVAEPLRDVPYHTGVVLVPSPMRPSHRRLALVGEGRLSVFVDNGCVAVLPIAGIFQSFQCCGESLVGVSAEGKKVVYRPGRQVCCPLTAMVSHAVSLMSANHAAFAEKHFLEVPVGLDGSGQWGNWCAAWLSDDQSGVPQCRVSPSAAMPLLGSAIGFALPNAGSRGRGATRMANPCMHALVLLVHMIYEGCLACRTHAALAPRIGSFVFALCRQLQLTDLAQYYLLQLGADGDVQWDHQGSTGPHVDVASLAALFTGDVRRVFDGSGPSGSSVVLNAFAKSGNSQATFPTARFLPDEHLANTVGRLSTAIVTSLAVVDNKLGRAGPSWYEVAIETLTAAEFDRLQYDDYSYGVSYFFHQAIRLMAHSANASTPSTTLRRLGRTDLLCLVTQRPPAPECSDVIRLSTAASDVAHDSTTDDSVSMQPHRSREWGDARLDIVQNMLNSAKQVKLNCRADGSETVYTLLKTNIKRTLAVSVGRGLLTLGTHDVSLRDTIPIPPLTLTGRTLDGLTIASDPAGPDKLLWPQFHNGCAAGLRFLSPRGSTTTASERRHWVLYQVRELRTSTARCGLLLAFGLRGQLADLQSTDVYSVLTANTGSGHDPTTIALMLGLSASFRQTGHSLVHKCISVHIQSLTPAHEDLEVSLEVQTAALISMGLLKQGCCDRFLVEVFMGELSRLPTDEHCRNREGYSVAAGFGLGFLLLGTGRGASLSFVEDGLLGLMEGGKRQQRAAFADDGTDACLGEALTSGVLDEALRESPESSHQCNKVAEGGYVNPAVSSPGAVCALTLMYLMTNDMIMARKLALPNTRVLLRRVAPLTAFLRVMGSNVILWSHIHPTASWVRQNIPPIILSALNITNTTAVDGPVLWSPAPPASAKTSDESSTLPPFVPQQPGGDQYMALLLGHVIGGALASLGLRFAGTMRIDARDTVLEEVKCFMAGKIGTTAVAINAVQKSAGSFESCISAGAVAAAMIMAGTGDIKTLAVLRKLQKRNVAYGEHVAISVAIGLLFLGGGRTTLSNSLESVAPMIVALYPQWPRDTTDNTHHLQALRHMFALAAVDRLVVARDAVTKELVDLDVRVVVHEGKVGDAEPITPMTAPSCFTPLPKSEVERAITLSTPCLLPDPTTIERVEVRSDNYFPLQLQGGPHLRDGLTLFVLRRPRNDFGTWTQQRKMGKQGAAAEIRHALRRVRSHNACPDDTSVHFLCGVLALHNTSALHPNDQAKWLLTVDALTSCRMELESWSRECLTKPGALKWLAATDRTAPSGELLRDLRRALTYHASYDIAAVRRWFAKERRSSTHLAEALQLSCDTGLSAVAATTLLLLVEAPA